jgi:hypothetical protein
MIGIGTQYGAGESWGRFLDRQNFSAMPCNALKSRQEALQAILRQFMGNESCDAEPIKNPIYDL